MQRSKQLFKHGFARYPERWISHRLPLHLFTTQLLTLNGPILTCLQKRVAMTFAILLMALPTSTLAAETAADLDWQPASPIGHCSGQYVEPGVDQSEHADGKVDASANSLLHVQEHSTTLTGDVRLRQFDNLLTADFATIDSTSQTYTAEGTVILRQPGLLLTGTAIQGNFENDHAIVDSATFLMHNNRLRGSAEKIDHSNNGALSVTNGKFTTCEPGNNAWAISGEQIVLRPTEGYGVARNVTLTVKDLPIAYFPYMRFPINESRQSGFLMPSLGSDSDGGTDIATPYYFNLAPNFDATYTPRSLWKRGLLHEGEVRWLNNSSSNMIAGTFLPSDDVYEGRSLDPTIIENEPDRWLMHVRHRGSYGKWSSNINFTRVSDIDYLNDLGGFTNTDAAFDRALDQSDEPALLRTGSLTWRHNAFSSTLSLRSFQNLNQLQPRQYEMLPRLEVNARKHWGRLQANASLQATEFDNTRSVTTGSRVVMDASLRAPIYNSWGFLRPGLRVIHRSYALDDTLPGARDNAEITTSIASLDAGLVFERNSSLFGRPGRQTIEPRIHYLYASNKDQNDLPAFDSSLITPGYQSLFRENRFTGYDRIGDENRWALGVTSRLFHHTTGQEIFSASLGQIFHQSDREVSLSPANPGAERLTDDNSPLFLEIVLSANHLRMRTSYEHDTESGGSNRGMVSFSYQPATAKLINLSYSMTDKSRQRDPAARNEEESDLSFYWPLGKSERWQIIGRWNYGWDSAQTIESLVGLEYNACCWKTRVLVRRNLEEPRAFIVNNPGQPTAVRFDRRADSGIYFEFQLKGLASLGGRLDTLLRHSIPNYLVN